MITNIKILLRSSWAKSSDLREHSEYYLHILFLISHLRRCGAGEHGSMLALAVLVLQLDSMILQLFFNLNDSMISPQTSTFGHCNKQELNLCAPAV